MKNKLLLVLCIINFTLGLNAQQVKILFDVTKAETVTNADWTIDADTYNLGDDSNGNMNTGLGNEANPQRYPTPAQSTVTASTLETYWSGSLSAWGIDCVKQGYEVESLPYNGLITYNDVSNPQDLSNYNIFIVDEPNITFSASEKDAIVNFVKNGGGLFMISDHNVSDRNNSGSDSPHIWNDLMANNTVQVNPFGMTFDYANFSQTTTNISTVANDSIVTGPMGTGVEMMYANGTSMTLSTTANSTVLGDVFMTGSSNTGTTGVMMAHAYYGQGKVVSLGDSSPPDDGTGDPNDALYNGWTADANGNHEILIMNATIWLAAQSNNTTTPPTNTLTRIYVDSSQTTNTPDGASWSTAFPKFEDGVSLATSSDTVFVAKGTYQPASGVSFSMKSAVKIYGGFAGTESSLSQRNLALGKNSILKGNGKTVIDNSTNSLTNSAVLDGFVIENGTTTGNGGGMNNVASSPTLVNLVFYNNASSGSNGGGGMCNSNSSPIITNVLFYKNTSTKFGGAMENTSSSSPKITNVTFFKNHSPSGGAMDNYNSSSPMISNSIFSGNTDNGTHPDIFDAGTMKITYSYTQTALTGTGNVQTLITPFVDSSNVLGADNKYMTADDGLRLSCGSLAINTGKNDSIPTGISKDISGSNRIKNSIVDMGAYESAGGNSSSTISASACASYTSPSGLYNWTATGTYNDTIANAAACDSVITVHLTISNSVTGDTTATACQQFTWYGMTYTNSGTLTHLLSSASGCDSTVTLHLTISNSVTGDTTATACQQFTWYGMTYTNSGTLTHLLSSASGCDSTVTLHLTISNSVTGDTTATACQQFTWYGMTYTNSGTLTHLLSSASGCDSTVTLHLTISNSVTGDTTATACQQFTWYGMTYTNSGTLTHLLSSASGCDSTVTLHLTISNSVTGDTTATACQQFTWYGMTYTNSGTLTHLLSSASGCDSTVTLHLTISNSVTGDTTATACQQFTWYGMTYTNSGTLTHLLSSASGCDSTVTLHLTISNSVTGDTTATACQQFTWYGMTYTNSGTLTHLLSSASGCDSTVTLHLTISNSVTGDTTATACQQFTWYGMTYTNSGTLTHLLSSASGCDSTVTLHLTINTVNTAVTQNGVTLASSATGANYKWLDCNNNYSVISGATNQTYVASNNGSYAVEISENGCVDTSACYNVTTAGIKENGLVTELVKVYPNPVNNELTIENQGDINQIEVYNVMGQLLQASNSQSTMIKLDFSTYEQGIYLVKIHTNDGQVATKRVIKD